MLFRKCHELPESRRITWNYFTSAKLLFDGSNKIYNKNV